MDEDLWGEEIEWSQQLEDHISTVEAAFKAAGSIQTMPAQPTSSQLWGMDVEWSAKLEEHAAAIEEAHQKSTGSSRPPPPHIAVELEDESATAIAPRESEPKKSLWQRFRKRQTLSVSDLVSPLWCEVQHSYRLESRAHLRPLDRPTSFVSATGTIIAVNPEATVARQAILDKGSEVHLVLEKQVMGDQELVRVEAVSREERWALRIINLILCLERLVSTGRAREIPIFGFVDSFIVFGVIDEVERRELPVLVPALVHKRTPSTPTSTPPSKLLPSKPLGEGQTTIEAFFSPSPSRKGKEKAQDQSQASPLTQPTPVAKAWGLVMSDTKTRYNASLPPKADSRSSRLQLMVYHHLLSALLTPPDEPSTSTTPSFPWSRLFEHDSLSPTAELSADFLTSLEPIIAGTSLESTLGQVHTLNDVIEALWRFADMLGPLERTLEISYRLRNAQKKRRSKRKKTPPSTIPADFRVTDDDEEAALLAVAIMESLPDSFNTEKEDTPDSQVALVDMDDAVNGAFLSVPAPEELPEDAPSSPLPVYDLPPNSQAVDEAPAPVSMRYNLRRRRPRSTDFAENAPASKRARRRTPSPPPRPSIPEPLPASADPPPSSPEVLVMEAGTLIGTEEFEFDSQELATFLEQTLQLWKGEREPVGVDLTRISRCRTCEFEDGCEWREVKAREAAARNKVKVRGRCA